MEVVKLFWALYNISMQHFFRVGLLEQPATRGGPRYTGRKSGPDATRGPENIQARYAGGRVGSVRYAHEPRKP